MSLNDQIDKAQAQGFGINLGKKLGEPWSCAIFGGYGKLNLRSYACKQGQSPEEALALCLQEVSTPRMDAPRRQSIELESLLHSLDLEM